MVQHLIAFVSFKNELNRFPANEFIQHLAVEIIFFALYLIDVLAKKIAKIFKIESILLCFAAVCFGDQLVVNFWMVFVDSSKCFVLNVAEKFSQEKGRMIGSTAKEHIFLYDFPPFDFEIFLFISFSLLIKGDFLGLSNGSE